MLTTVPVSSVSLTGLPSPNWTHLWRELLPFPWWRGLDLAGLLGMTTMPPLTESTVELESSRTSSLSSGTMLWRPTIGQDEDAAVLAGPAKPWTPACRGAWADLWQLCSDWLSSADELTGPLNAFLVGAPLWNIECWTASQWTGSLHLEWGRTSRSWWSSQETGALWWLSGRAVELVPEYLPWSASRLSKRVASHLAALTATRRVSAAWWTPVEKSPVQTEDKWTGTPSCWPRNADTCGQPDASVHEDRHPVCLSTPSNPDFWWQIGRTLASPSWSAVPPCGGWEWTGLLQVVDLLSSWEPETTDCRIPGTSRWWLALWLPSSASIDGLLKILSAVPGPELILWWVSWGRCWNAMPTPSSTMPAARQLPSRLRQCGAKSARRVPTWDPSTLSGWGSWRSLARLLASLEGSWTGPSGASSKGRLLCHSPLRRGGRGPQAVKHWRSWSRFLGWRHLLAGLGFSLLREERQRWASHHVGLPDGTDTILKDLWFGTHHIVSLKRCRPHSSKNLGLEVEVL